MGWLGIWGLAPAENCGRAPHSTPAHPHTPPHRNQCSRLPVPPQGLTPGNSTQVLPLSQTQFPSKAMVEPSMQNVHHCRRSVPQKQSRRSRDSTGAPRLCIPFLAQAVAPHLSRFAPHEDCALLHLKSDLFSISQLWREAHRRKVKCPEYGPPGHGALGIFKGCFRMDSFSGTTLPLCPPLCPLSLYGRCLV